MSSPGATKPVDVPRASTSSNHRTSSDRELLQSLDKLSLSTSPSGRLSVSPSSRFSASLGASPSNAPPRSPSNLSRRPSWTPSTKALSNTGSTTGSTSRSATPTLLRKSSTQSLKSVNGATPHRAPSRKSSANNLRSPAFAPKSPLNIVAQPAVEYIPKPVATPVSVACDYFKKELEYLHASSKPHSADTIVVIHDACYGHRFSRPKATRGHLFSIVERPERLAASVLGVAMAYVRLGERHSDGKNPIHPDLDPTTLESVPFHIHKTTRSVPLTDAVVTNVHGTKWMEELNVMCETADTKLAVSGNELKRPDMNRGPDADPPQKLHEGDLYLCDESRNAFEGALGAVCEAVDVVFSDATAHKRAFVAVRPPGHHCSASFPSGFCWVNNVHVGIMHAILKHGLTHAAIIDFDLHHGDGSQAIAWQHNQRGNNKNAAAWKKTSIGYFSVHDINSFPCEWGDDEKVRNASVCIDNAHGQNVWNVHLHEWKTEVDFWKLYQSKYSILLEKTRQYCKLQTEKYRSLGQEPRGAIFLSAGFDASEYETDGMQRHKVNVPTEFYARLTRDVVRIASEEGLSVEGRVISVLEGGYSDRALYSGVMSHLGGLAATDSINPKDDIKPELSHEMSSRIASVGRRRSTLTSAEINDMKVPGFPYDPLWWSRSELDLFDSYDSPTPQEPRKPRTSIVPTYSSPTHASSARETDLAKVKRSLSTTSNHNGVQTMMYRVPTPPPPDVPWPAAVKALGKLLVPGDRQTTSFTWEELNAETKARKERQATAIALDVANRPPPPPTPRASTRMSLRERKPAKVSDPLESLDLDKGRRKTVGGAAFSSKEKTSGRTTPVQSAAGHSRSSSRRLSASSALITATQGPAEQPASVAEHPEAQEAIPLTINAQPISQPVLNVKKTRATPRSSPAKPRGRKPKEPATTGVTTSKLKAPLLSRTTSESSKPKATLGETAPLPPVPASERPARTRASLGKDELDNLTNGMKRIKINVLTKEKKEERAKLEAQRLAAVHKEEVASETSNEANNKTTLTTGEASSSRSGTYAGEEAPVTPGLQAPSQAFMTPQAPYTAPAAASHVKLEEENDQPIAIDYKTDLSTDIDSSPAHRGSATPSDLAGKSSPMTPTIPQDEPFIIQYQPEGPPASSVPLSGPVQILEPNTGTPIQFKNKSPERKSVASPSPLKASQFSKFGHQFTATSKLSFTPLNPGAGSGTGSAASSRPSTAASKGDLARSQPSTPTPSNKVKTQE